MPGYGSARSQVILPPVSQGGWAAPRTGASIARGSTAPGAGACRYVSHAQGRTWEHRPAAVGRLPGGQRPAGTVPLALQPFHLPFGSFLPAQNRQSPAHLMEGPVEPHDLPLRLPFVLSGLRRVGDQSGVPIGLLGMPDQ